MNAQTELAELIVDGTTLDGADLGILIGNMPGLTSLELSGVVIGDVDVASLAASAPSIVELSLGLARPRDGYRFTASRLTGAVLARLEALPSL